MKKEIKINEIKNFYSYNTAKNQFILIKENKDMSTIVDAISIKKK